MIIDRYERPVDWVAPEPSDPVLQDLEWMLDEPELFALYEHDLRAHYKRSRWGRHTVSIEASYRLTFLRRRKKWTYRQAEETVRDSPAYQAWVRVYDHPVPDHTTQNDLERCVRPPTLHRMNDRLLVLAQAYHLTRGYCLRVDSSVCESRSHYPTDSSLLVDGVRVLSRLLKRAAPYLSARQRAAGWCVSHLRSAKRRGRQITEASRSEAVKTKHPRRSKASATLKKSYRELLHIVRATLAQAQQVWPAMQQDPTPAAQRLAQQLTELLPLVQRAIEQTEQRIVYERPVAAPDKVVSLCEPHTQILRRGKAKPHQTEFGHKVNYAEVEHGFISDWQVIEQGNPSDADLLPPILHQHRERFGYAPHLLAVDRGAFSPENEALARQMRIKHIVLPKPGYRDGRRQRREKQAWFKRGQRFRNGIEGRISVVKRTMQLARCPCHGFERFEQWIGWGVLTANLVTLARLYRKRHRRKPSC